MAVQSLAEASQSIGDRSLSERKIKRTRLDLDVEDEDIVFRFEDVAFRFGSSKDDPWTWM